MSFPGFPRETFAFLDGISANNEKAWFDANRPLYEAGYVEPAKAFVAELGPRLREIAPNVQFEPKVNGSIGRINRDIRFSKDKRPYKTHLGMWFWLGDKKGWDMPGFWFSIERDAVHLGTGMYGFEKQLLENYRNSVIHPRSGKALVAIAEGLTAKGYEIGGKTRKLMPRGYETDASRADYLLYEGLYARTEMKHSDAGKKTFADKVVAHYAATWPLAKWLLEEVVD